MNGRRWRHDRFVNQYSHEYHQSRAVQCCDCGVSLHKDHFYVYYGNRCHPCWQASITAVVPVAPVESTELVADTTADAAYEEEYTHGAYSQV